MTATINQESVLWQHDTELMRKYPVIAGLDEAGRGPLAGNVVAGCAILDLSRPIPDINDSKQLSEKRREKLYDVITAQALYWGIGECSPAEIDEHNILRASLMAMKRALEASGCSPDIALVDGNQRVPGLACEQRTLVKGDGRSASIAAASILAKVTRDRQMRDLHEQYPEYGFLSNKGYGTKDHINAILKHSMTPVHRRSFKPSALSQLDLFTT